MSELKNFSEWLGERGEFLSETELEFQEWVSAIENRVEKTITAEKLKQACGLGFSENALVEIRRSTSKFAVSHALFYATRDTEGFNSRLQEIEDASRTLIELLDPTIDDECSVQALDFLWPNRPDAAQYRNFKAQLQALATRSQILKQKIRKGQPKRYGTELDFHIIEIRRVWLKAGGKGHGAYHSRYELKYKGILLSLVRATLDSARAVVTEVSDRKLEFLPISNSTLTHRIKKVGKDQQS